MKIKHYQGVVVDVPDAKAARMTAGGSWTYVDAPAEKASEPVLDAPRIEDTDDGVEDVPDPSEAQEDASEVKAPPTIPEIREWALKNDVEGVKPKGKLARTVIDAYLEAHKE